MKKMYTTVACLLVMLAIQAQVTYIGILGNNTGGGTSNNVFNKYVGVTSDVFIDFEVFATGLSGGDACGTKTQARVILRTSDDNDPTSVVASAPIIVPATCTGKNGNNDKYFVNLKTAIASKPGRYSIEIQADVTGGTGTAYDRSTAGTTWNYNCPRAYYLTAASGSTGTYYDLASGACASGTGKSDPIGGTNVDRMTQIAPAALKYFTVGESGVFRDMVVFSGTFYDMQLGKFGPGNPRVPASIGDITLSASGPCPNGSGPTLSMGGEINIFKRTDCSADVTESLMQYRVYKAGTTAPVFSSFNIPFQSNCGATTTGPETNIFNAGSVGGSCQNQDGILDQRWQVASGVANIIPSGLTTADIGVWNVEFQTVTTVKNCSGATSTITSSLNTTTFSVNGPAAGGAACSFVLNAALKNIQAFKTPTGNNLTWQVTTANHFANYEIERSYTGSNFTTIGNVVASANTTNFNYADNTVNTQQNTVYYRLVLTGANGSKQYSQIVKVSKTGLATKLTAIRNGVNTDVKMENLAKGNYQLSMINVDGKVVATKMITATYSGNYYMDIAIPKQASGLLIGVLKNIQTNTTVGTVKVLY